MLGEMKDAELRASLDELVGPEFIDAYQRAMVVEMQTAIVQHVSRVLGELDDDDPESVQRVRGLLAPIDNFRARAPQGGGGDGAGGDEGSGALGDTGGEPPIAG
jgi:hypothetical protein